MKSKKTKKNFDPINLKIISELMAFYMSNGANDVDINLKLEDNFVTICISAKINPLSEEYLSEVLEHLNTPRQHELESYYWQLGGEDEDSDLSLIGVMIDEVQHTYENDKLTLNLTRFNQSSEGL
ncbi:hypothetical protein ACPWSR_05995 [Alloiococcus sp. CFN-8]|uniref:hypothetical protein n=1 Tax=Alloiococcus sp. CFN-8 TaxID=3416081 RepID=UPI003CF0B37D